MTRRRRRKLIAIALLTLLLAALGLWYWNFRATRSLRFNIATTTADAITPPDYLYSFSGEGENHVRSPLGVLADGELVYVVDSRLGRVMVFRPDGTYVRSFGQGKLVTPLYIAKNPRNGRFYVSDRRNRSVEIFDASGKHVGTFDPKLPKQQLPKIETKGDQWVPVALAFAPDGTFYVTELLGGHRLLIFDPQGNFKKSIGDLGVVLMADQAPEMFQFPNSIKVTGQEVWVVDSNNRRIQVFDREGTFKRILPVQGLPRGMAFIPRARGETEGVPAKAMVVDTLSHDVTIWNTRGERLAIFGGHGVLEGQFNFPIDVSVGGSKRLAFVTDSGNVRVQVWGWPEYVSPIPPIRVPPYWYFCFAPLLLLPLLLLLRKKRFAVTYDFAEGMIIAELAHHMPARRRRWVTTLEHYERSEHLEQGDIRMAELLEISDYSESDARELRERLELDEPTAAILTVARRAKVFCTEDAELRRLAKLLEVDVVDRQEFMERFAKKDVEPPAPSEAAELHDVAGPGDASAGPRQGG